jgi:2-oxoglutarate dehydrogenase E2 component (dihydrolipoamide succinyltransferase)
MEPSDPDQDPTPTDETEENDGADEGSEAEPAGDTLSPAVRRLVRQYELDITEISGTGPNGRIRVSDVMTALGSRGAPPAAQLQAADSTGAREERAAARAFRGEASAAPIPVTSLFECDMTAVLAHRKQMLAEKADYLLTSYYIVACAAALRGVPEANGGHARIDIAVALSAPGGSTVTPVLRDAEALSLASVNDALRAVHKELVENQFRRENEGEGSFLVYHHGVTGSLIATPTPLAPSHAASLGVGRIRRKVAVQNVSDQSGPRIAPMCYVSLTFRPDRLDLHRANQFLSLVVRRLERWPNARNGNAKNHGAS